jgi:hypothetical protein
VPWFRLDIHWYLDAKLEASGEAAGPLALLLFPVLLAKAKAELDGGRARFTFRELSNATFAKPAEIVRALEGLVSAGVLTCPQLSEVDGQVAFDPDAWRRWNEAQRKAASREERDSA